MQKIERDCEMSFVPARNFFVSSGQCHYFILKFVHRRKKLTLQLKGVPALFCPRVGKKNLSTYNRCFLLQFEQKIVSESFLIFCLQRLERDQNLIVSNSSRFLNSHFFRQLSPQIDPLKHFFLAGPELEPGCRFEQWSTQVIQVFSSWYQNTLCRAYIAYRAFSRTSSIVEKSVCNNRLQ